MATRESHSQDLRTQAAVNWGKRHGTTTSDAYRNEQFRHAWNRFVENPLSAKNRKAMGFRDISSGMGRREARELQLVRELKKFGNTP